MLDSSLCRYAGKRVIVLALWALYLASSSAKAGIEWQVSSRSRSRIAHVACVVACLLAQTINCLRLALESSLLSVIIPVHDNSCGYAAHQEYQCKHQLSGKWTQLCYACTHAAARV